MIKHIYSEVEPNKLLHAVFDFDDCLDRHDISPPSQFLQVAAMKPTNGKKYAPHYHLWKKTSFDNHVAQESWVVISGAIKVSYYDIDNKLLTEEIVKERGCSITYEGGHAYEILENNTLVYEFKIGPYHGKENDKSFI